MTPNRAPTREEIERVRRHECTLRGHSWDVIETLAAVPTHVVCTRCGVSYRVVSAGLGGSE